jgi:HSP20 family protein
MFHLTRIPTRRAVANVAGAFETVFKDFSTLYDKSSDLPFAPRTNAYETEDEYQFEVELSGVALDDIDVEHDEGFLVITAERKDERSEEEEGVLRRKEFAYGKFERRFQLGLGANINGIKAVHKDGILRVTVPKSKRRNAKVKIKSE